MVGVSIRGGLTLGFGAAGFVKFVQENNIPIDMWAGSSSGAIVAAAAAAGIKSDYAINKLLRFNFWRDFATNPYAAVKNRSLVGREKLEKTMDILFKGVDIEDLPTKLAVFVTCENKRRKISLQSGNLTQALVASISYPYIFPQGVIDGVKYYDGDFDRTWGYKEFVDEGITKVIGVRGRSNKGLKDTDRLSMVIEYNTFGHSRFNFSKLGDLIDDTFRMTKLKSADLINLTK